MKYETFLEDINVDLELIDIRDNVDEHWTKRALAGASVGTDPVPAYDAVDALASAVKLVVAGSDIGKRHLAMILTNGSDYQRNLWFSVAGRDPFAVASDFAWFTEILGARAEMWAKRTKAQRSVTKERDPYYAQDPEGPTAVFDPNFELGPQWDGIAIRV